MNFNLGGEFYRIQLVLLEFRLNEFVQSITQNVEQLAGLSQPSSELRPRIENISVNAFLFNSTHY